MPSLAAYHVIEDDAVVMTLPASAVKVHHRCVLT
jgi:hypothetical protein